MTDAKYFNLSSGLAAIQDAIATWSHRNFDPIDLPASTLGLLEEAGEVARAVLKQYQEIRGTWEEWQEEIKKEIGDVFIKLCDVSDRAGLEIEDCIIDRWESVRQRDWRADSLKGNQA